MSSNFGGFYFIMCFPESCGQSVSVMCWIGVDGVSAMLSSNSLELVNVKNFQDSSSQKKVLIITECT